MGGLLDKAKGSFNEAVGKAKEKFGDDHNKSDLAAEGQAQQVTGKAQQLKGKVEGALGNDI